MAFSAPSCPPRATLIPAGKNKSDLIWLSPSYCQGLLEQCKTRQSRTWLEFTECSVVFALVPSSHLKLKAKTWGMGAEKGRRHCKDKAFCLMPHGLVSTAGMDEQLTTTCTLQLCPCECLHERICGLHMGSHSIIHINPSIYAEPLSVRFNWTHTPFEPLPAGGTKTLKWVDWSLK